MISHPQKLTQHIIQIAAQSCDAGHTDAANFAKLPDLLRKE
jgi:hypothetical protein